MRLRPNSATLPVNRSRRRGYTLVEILVATALTLILMTAVVTVFGGVGDGISKSRRAMEQFDRLRTAVQQLRLDLQGITVKLDGHPVRPEENAGYFELIEGGILSVPQANGSAGSPQAVIADDLTITPLPRDYAVGERGDILMFTTRNAARPFVGRYQLSVDPNNATLQSDVAEVAWFLRGKTLHRRVLLVAPGVGQNQSFASLPAKTFYANNDISVHRTNGRLVANSLGDLTKRENRFAHPIAPQYVFPFDVRAWGVLGLPTLAECSSPTWMANWGCGSTPPPSSTPVIDPRGIDMWDRSTDDKLNVSQVLPDQYLNNPSKTIISPDGVRLADDVILTNVIGFDVKVWEPAVNNGMGGYVDLGYNGKPLIQSGVGPFQVQDYPVPQGPSSPRFQHPGVYAPAPTAPYTKYSLVATAQYPQRVYDSGCFSYENEGIYHFDQNGNVQSTDVPGGRSTNGLDDPVPPPNNPNGTPVANGIVDDVSEQITSSPYPVALRGIQVKIRCYEPDSRQIREITIENDFLPK
jgi:prepilin-type N-terminal cleavage/methylation domain-containing protein